MEQQEYSATDIRKLLHQLFPERRLVLSQFTFFNQTGVSKATGETFRRGRRCYKLRDILPIACILALKEEGIPYKNVEALPALIQENSDIIFELGEGCRVSGYGNRLVLQLKDEEAPNEVLEAFLSGEGQSLLFWSFDIGLLARQLEAVAMGSAMQPSQERVLKAA